MADNPAERVSVELTPDEAKLVIAALRKFEPYWPGDLGELDRAELLAGIRVAIDRVTSSLSASGTAAH
jgi:hypothetical protein